MRPFQAGAAVVSPRTRSFGHSLEGIGPPGPTYYVLVSAHFRACTAKGRLAVRIRERKEIGGYVKAEHFRRFSVAQRRRCTRHAVTWRLGDRFFGIGYYKLRLKVKDRFGRESEPRFSSHFTAD
jgi:hypothetical protein